MLETLSERAPLITETVLQLGSPESRKRWNKDLYPYSLFVR
jgi:hypothetical protein